MYHRRHQSDSKSPTNLSNSTASMPTKPHAQSVSSLQSSTISRVSIYTIRDKIRVNNMNKVPVKLSPEAQAKLICQFHQEIPSIRLDGHLTYCLYTTIQNLIHLNVMYILLYHAIFWLNPTKPNNEVIEYMKKIENTEYEQTLFLAIKNNRDDIIKPKINVHLINKYVYITLIILGTIELFSAFLWTLQKKLSFFIQRNLKWRHRWRLLLLGLSVSLYLTFIAWLIFHTFITRYLTLIIFIPVISHMILLTILDKPNLFQDTSYDLSRESFSTTTLNRKQYRHSPSTFSVVSPTTINPTGRFSRRTLVSLQSRKVNSIFRSFFSSLISTSRWLSVTEQNLDIHECSFLYTEIRQNADHLWSMVVRRMALQIYRTFTSFIFFDLLPYIMIDTNIPLSNNHHYKILTIIFALSTFLTQSVFLFPIKFQANLHRLSTHLGQWRLKPFDQTDTIHQWSSECNSYTYGNVIKLSSNPDQYYIALQHLSNAAHPQSKSHSVLYRFFSDTTYVLTIQFTLCLILLFSQVFWILRGQFAFEILISLLIILNSSYTIFKIIRDRLLFDMIDEHESDEVLVTSQETNQRHLT